MIICNKYEIPDECPNNCKYKDDIPYQGNTCSRCPIFNCSLTKCEEYGNFRLIEPENYREDWGKDWYEYFKNLEAKKDR